jgi:uncharacterized membrane protein YvbJ
MIACPQCQADVSEADAECPKCGILFTKWKERESNVASGNLSKYSSIANATSSEFNWTVLIVIAIAVAGLFFFLAQNAKEALKDI